MSAPLTATANAGANSISINTTNLAWNVGDTITIDTEAVTINTLSAGSIGFGTGQTLGQAHSSATAIVGNLSRNVVVRSSGTNTSLNTAYIDNLASAATSFSLNYGEFAYLGATTGGNQSAIKFDGGNISISASGVGSLSSCTVHNGGEAIFIADAGDAQYSQSGQITLSSNLIFNNADGIYVGSSNNNTVVSNNSYANAGVGIHTNSDGYTTIALNNVFFNYADGLDVLSNLAADTIVGNKVYSNNTGASGNDDGIGIAGPNNILVGNYVYSNFTNQAGSGGVWLEGTASGNLWVGGGLGYTPAGVPAPDGNAEVYMDNSANNLVMKNALVNPSPGIPGSDFQTAGEYLVNYSSGVVQVYGDYVVNGSTLTLDYASQLYTSTSTNLKLMIGSGHAATVNTTSDANAVSQLISITYNGSNWIVTGSSTTGTLCTIAAGGNTGSPASCGSPVQFTLTVNPGATRNPGDIWTSH